MKCPKCQQEMSEGSLFCEHCYHEIKMVPEFDARLHDKISETMSSISSELAGEAEPEGEVRQDADLRKESVPKTEEGPRNIIQEPEPGADIERTVGKRKLPLEITVLSAMVAAILIIAGGMLLYTHSDSYRIGRVYKLSSSGNYEKAAAMLGDIISDQKQEDPELILQRAEYLQKAVLYEEDEALLKELISELEKRQYSPQNEDYLVRAYNRLVSLLSEQDRYDAIAEQLAACSSEKIQNMYRSYMVHSTESSASSGEYEDELMITLSSGGEDSVFYTLDGTSPTTGSLLYSGPFHLGPGDYELRAAAFNPFGVCGEEAVYTYRITSSVPENPRVLTAGGQYSRATLISVLVPDHQTVYYTDDGSDPTEDSLIYEKPISMPTGTTTFKFIAANEAGVLSGITEETYVLNPQGNISPEEGINYILVVMINRGEILNASGALPGGTAAASYQYDKTWQASGRGNYYLYTEYVTDLYGNSAATGRILAVNIVNGTVNFLIDGELQPIG